MQSVEEILNKDMLFCKIERTTATHIEFSIWEKPLSLDIKGYRFFLPMDEGFNVLNMIFKKRVPSNYYIFQLQDKLTLSALRKDESIYTDELLQRQRISTIEIKTDPNNMNSILFNLVKNGAFIKTKSGDYKSINNLVFNRNNLNISHRSFDNINGFDVMYLYEYFGHDLEVETVYKIEGSYVKSYEKVGEVYRSYLTLEGRECKPQTLWINGKEADQIFCSIFLSIDYYLYLFSTQFNLEITKKFMEAIYSYYYSFETNVNSRRSSNARKDKICTIEPVVKIPTISYFNGLIKEYELLNNIDNEDIVERFLTRVKNDFDRNTRNMIKPVIDFLRANKYNRHLSVAIEKEEMENKYALAGLRSHALRSTLYSNKIFLQMYSNLGNELGIGSGEISSTIFNAVLNIKSYRI